MRTCFISAGSFPRLRILLPMFSILGVTVVRLCPDLSCLAPHDVCGERDERDRGQRHEHRVRVRQDIQYEAGQVDGWKECTYITLIKSLSQPNTHPLSPRRRPAPCSSSSCSSANARTFHLLLVRLARAWRGAHGTYSSSLALTYVRAGCELHSVWSEGIPCFDRSVSIHWTL